MIQRIAYLVAVLGILASCSIAEEPALSVEDASAALHKAVGFFRSDVSVNGSYLWKYSADLSLREGEGKATELTAWVQPPGTPTVGDAFLRAFDRTGDTFYLDAARETAHALVQGQLESGGWDYRIEFAPERRRKYAYRKSPNNSGGKNVTTLDDDTTQAALRFLMRADRALDFKDKAIHEAAQYALESLLKAQYPNGAWPQRYSEFPNPDAFAVKRAGYPESWSWTHPSLDYRAYYTFNDNALADMIRTMFEAAVTYNENKYRKAAERAGDFILMAQMPEPQPAWAQQYDVNMCPAWARKFEPPSVTGGESQGVMRILLDLYRRTGKEKYLAPIPQAIAYLRSSQLPNGRLARFYELETNKPLYFTKDYKLTYSSDDMPTHYAFIVTSTLDAIEKEYERVKKLKVPVSQGKQSVPKLTRAMAQKAVRIVAQLDERGAWVESGALKNYPSERPATRIIDCRTFINNVDMLSIFTAAK